MRSSSSSRSLSYLLAVAIAIGLLSAGPPLFAQITTESPEPIGPTGAAPEGVPQYTSSGPDLFFLHKRNIVMSELSLEVPMPDYELVDVAGDFKNDPDGVACGGTVSEGTAEDADECITLYQLTFENGYLKTAGTVVTPNATAYNAKPANVEIVGHVGDVVQITVKNELPEAVNGEAIATGFYAPADNKQIIHWHGMELDNESDGTPITEFGIETGEQRLYQFRLYRPGTYWFHPHVLPLLTESRGMVGRLIVRTYEEDLLSLAGILPLQYKAFQLTDSTVASEFNRDAFRNGVVFEDFFTEEEVDNHLMPNIAPDLNSDGVCNRGPGDCVVPEGELVFVNGVVPTSDTDIPTVYVPEGRGVRVAFINSSNERFYRFRLLLDGEEPPAGPAERVNRATTGQCYAPGSSVKFSGADPLSCEQGLPLYRVAGQNGLLDYVRIEGQLEIPPADPFVPRGYDTVIRRGEDFVGIAERVEFVVLTKDREGDYLEPGESMFIWTIDYPHGLFTPFFDNNIGDGDTNNRDVHARKLVRIKVVPNTLGLPSYTLAEGDPLMAHSLVHRPADDIKSVAAVDLSEVPLGLDPFLGTPFEGSEDENIVLTNEVADETRFPSINAVKGNYEGVTAAGDQVPTQGATRYARLGDVVEFVYANNTGNAHHPFHMHGFSFQPISIHDFDEVDTNGDGVTDSVSLIDPPVYTFGHNEYVDVEVMQPGKALKYRMKMNDRFKIPDETPFTWLELLEKFPYDYQASFGGAGDLPSLSTGADMGGGQGRWLFHCHILHHAALGMISDLCIAPAADPDASACKIDVDEDIYESIP